MLPHSPTHSTITLKCKTKKHVLLFACPECPRVQFSVVFGSPLILSLSLSLSSLFSYTAGHVQAPPRSWTELPLGY